MVHFLLQGISESTKCDHGQRLKAYLMLSPGTRTSIWTIKGYNNFFLFFFLNKLSIIFLYNFFYSQLNEVLKYDLVWLELNLTANFLKTIQIKIYRQIRRWNQILWMLIWRDSTIGLPGTLTNTGLMLSAFLRPSMNIPSYLEKRKTL